MAKAAAKKPRVAQQTVILEQGQVDMQVETLTPDPQTFSLPAVQQNETSKIMSFILEQSKNKGFDIAKLEKMIALQDRMRADQAAREFIHDFAEVKPLLPRVISSKENTHTKSKYAPLEDINAVVEPIIGKKGFGLSHKIIQQDAAGVTVNIRLMHISGHIEETPVWMPYDHSGSKGSANKNAPQGVKSAIQYAKRTGVCLLLNISTGDDTDGNADKDPNAPKQADAFEAAMDEEDDRFGDGKTIENKPIKAKAPAAKMQGQEDEWDGKTIVTGHHADGSPSGIQRTFASAPSAAMYLKKIMESHKTKKSRLELIRDNTPLVRALVKGKHADTMTELHALADQGEA